MPQHDWTSKGVDGCLIRPLWRSKAGPAKGSYPRLDTFMHGCVKYMFIVCVWCLSIYVRVRGSRYLRQPRFGTWPAASFLASHMRPYGAKRAHMGPPGVIWSQYKPIWAHMGPYGDHMAHITPYGPIWAHMGPCGPMGPGLGQARARLKNAWLC